MVAHSGEAEDDEFMKEEPVSSNFQVDMVAQAGLSSSSTLPMSSAGPVGPPAVSTTVPGRDVAAGRGSPLRKKSKRDREKDDDSNTDFFSSFLMQKIVMDTMDRASDRRERLRERRDQQRMHHQMMIMMMTSRGMRGKSDGDDDLYKTYLKQKLAMDALDRAGDRRERRRERHMHFQMMTTLSGVRAPMASKSVSHISGNLAGGVNVLEKFLKDSPPSSPETLLDGEF
eukprot:CAMPEP_0194316816 /NCGR_PEP_ID=MMETSP0171-20130528/13589_1 /TAXON_ID=218684 /ORGANISM="Corethron pennatum, Strain L29A3" /LENGTH=227 /DNA_ID=CAMNT_0039073193 /DNA_START=325 /DNA_END=1008 /DNA_ORIENTATION=-